MKFDELPLEIKQLVFSKLPKHIIIELLESQTYAPLAYEVYYKEIIVGESSWSKYKIEGDYKDMPKFEFYKEHDFHRLWPFFPNVKALVLFYKTHPLFVPHTLHYDTFEQLNELHRQCPELLKKFKWFCTTGDDFYQDNTPEWPEFDLSSLNHKVYEMIKGEVIFPEMVVEIHLNHDLPLEPMESVDSVVLFSDDWQECQTLFPNMKKFKIVSTNALDIDIPSLTHFSAPTSENVNLSKLTSLQEATLGGSGTVGTLDSHNYILPLTITILTLHHIVTNTALEEIHTLTCLKTLYVSFQAEFSFGPITFGFPPNLEKLKIESVFELNPLTFSITEQQRGILHLCDMNYPEKLKKFILRGYITTANSFKFPNCETVKLEFFHPQNESRVEWNSAAEGVTKKLVCSHETVIYASSIPNIEYLDIITVGAIRNSHELKHLKHWKQEFRGHGQTHSFEIQPSVETIFWLYCSIASVTGGEYLTKLSLDHCKMDAKYHSFKRLKFLHLEEMNGHVFLSNLPDSLFSLTVIRSTIKGHVICPEYLRFLELTKCKELEGKLEINPRLHVLYLTGIQFNVSRTLRTVRQIKRIRLESCILNRFEVDFSKTKLEYFQIACCTYVPGTTKFPASLISFKSTDYRVFNSKVWPDLSLCTSLCVSEFKERTV